MKELVRIESSQNSGYKKLSRLFQKSRERRATNSFVVEGKREIDRALSNGYKVLEIWCREPLNTSITANCTSFELKKELFDKLTLRGASVSEIGVFESKQYPLAELKLSADARILVAEAPEKPGNIGALIRTAAGAGLDAVFIANPKTDLYNPQSIRNSMGGIFSIPIVMDQTTTIIDYLKKKSFFIAAADLSEQSITYTRCTLKSPWAIVVGTEDEGLQELWLENATACLQIPMTKPIDSLNVSVAAGILIYNALG